MKMPNLINYNYWDEQGAEALPTFKYKGTNLSVYYDKCLSPLCLWFVDHILPKWISPNLMTITGFVCVCVAHAILYFDSDKFEYPCYTR